MAESPGTRSPRAPETKRSLVCAWESEIVSYGTSRTGYSRLDSGQASGCENSSQSLRGPTPAAWASLGNPSSGATSPGKALEGNGGSRAESPRLLRGAAEMKLRTAGGARSSRRTECPCPERRAGPGPRRYRTGRGPVAPSPGLWSGLGTSHTFPSLP